MRLVIGTDEAGYGPNLGPLVVAATAWHVAGDAEAAFARLAAAGGPGNQGPLWADSKSVYRAGVGLAALERGVHAALELAGESVSDWPGLAAAVGRIGPEPDAADWTELAGLTLPREATAADCHAAATAARPCLAAAGLTLAAIACRAVYPAEFNRLLDRGLNKSDILSQVTLELAAAVGGRFPASKTLMWCDRHGGRKGYAALVGRHFAAPLVATLEETPARSAYLVPDAGLQIEFTVGGEARVPVALASMTAKYVRELAMEAFNAFWQARAPGLAPTAGYPLDARRWRAAAAEAIGAVGVPADHLWRRA